MAQDSIAAEIRNLGNSTFPRLALQHGATRPSAAALREKSLGIWQTLTWGELLAEAERLAGGLLSFGFQRGEHLALVGDNRPRLYAAMLAAQAIGGVPVPMYQDAAASELAYVFKAAEIGFAIVENQEQVDKLLEVRESHAALAHIFFDDPRGLRNYEEPGLQAYERLVEAGKAYAQAHPGFFAAQVEAGSPEDPAAMFSTSGTTGVPKGVIHSHRNLIAMSTAASQMERLTSSEEVMAYLPMAWIGQNIFSYAQWLVNGFTVNCPESQATMMSDMREIGPTYFFAPPRVFESLLTQVTIRMDDAARPKRWLYETFMGVARRVGEKILNHEAEVGVMDRLLYALGNLTVYAPLRNALGMSRVRLAYTAGEAIGPDLFIFYRSLGINLKQLYGQTETAVFVCVQPDGEVRSDTVGPPMRGVELKVSAAGELLVRSPGVLTEYYKNPEATAEVKDADGWYHTGDAGYLDQQGHLRIIDRAKDVGKLANGELFAPKYIENKLKFFPYIKEAVAFGNGAEQVMAFVNIDMQACGNWAERNNLPYTGYVDLAAKPEILGLVRDCVEKVNADLAADPVMAASQMHGFLVLPKELDADDEELTRTSKVRRRYIAQKYDVLVQALYAGRKEQHIDIPVRFEDGRTGRVSANVRIEQARTFPSAAAQKKAA